MSRKRVKISLAKKEPKLIVEWDYDRNKIDPENVSYASDTKYYWVCLKDPFYHRWTASPSNRTIKHTGCPFCANRSVCLTNCLAFCFPEIANELHPKNNIFACDIIATSLKKYYWICKEGHEWRTTVEKRTVQGQHCPKCTNRQVSPTNNLAFRCPELAKEWHPKNILKPEEIVACTGKIYWWICGNGHEYPASPSNRINDRGCPDCRHKGENYTKEILTELHLDPKKTKLNVSIVFNEKKSVNYIMPDFYFIWNGQEFYVEYNGRQHFEPVKFGNITQEEAEEAFKNQQIRDQYFRDHCLKNNITLIEIDGRLYTSKEEIKAYLLSLFPFNRIYFQLASHQRLSPASHIIPSSETDNISPTAITG